MLYLDDTGLLFYNARYYDPGIGRFVSADTIVPGNAMGGMDGIALKPLTVAFHEYGFISKLAQENQFGPWFTLSDKERESLGNPMGPSNSQALNRYSYVMNNPLRYTDPSGHVYDHVTNAWKYWAQQEHAKIDRWHAEVSANVHKMRDFALHALAVHGEITTAMLMDWVKNSNMTDGNKLLFIEAIETLEHLGLGVGEQFVYILGLTIQASAAVMARQSHERVDQDLQMGLFVNRYGRGQIKAPPGFVCDRTECKGLGQSFRADGT